MDADGKTRQVRRRRRDSSTRAWTQDGRTCSPASLDRRASDGPAKIGCTRNGAAKGAAQREAEQDGATRRAVANQGRLLLRRERRVRLQQERYETSTDRLTTAEGRRAPYVRGRRLDRPGIAAEGTYSSSPLGLKSVLTCGNRDRPGVAVSTAEPRPAGTWAFSELTPATLDARLETIVINGDGQVVRVDVANGA